MSKPFVECEENFIDSVFRDGEISKDNVENEMCRCAMEEVRLNYVLEKLRCFRVYLANLLDVIKAQETESGEAEVIDRFTAIGAMARAEALVPGLLTPAPAETTPLPGMAAPLPGMAAPVEIVSPEAVKPEAPPIPPIPPARMPRPRSERARLPDPTREEPATANGHSPEEKPAKKPSRTHNDRQRIDVARYIARSGPGTVGELVKRLGISEGTISEVLEHEWFEKTAGRINISNDARQAVMEKRDD